MENQQISPIHPCCYRLHWRIGIKDGKCLMVQVMKTTHLSFATREDLHITIAYHADVDLPMDIVKITRRWLRGLSISQRRISLRRWGDRSYTLEGPLDDEMTEFRREAGLTLSDPLHIEFHEERGCGHWTKKRYIGPIPDTSFQWGR